MERVRYIHAADLHLDTPFKGFSGASGPGDALRNATFTALENLATLCEQEEPDFLLLAGDIYNQEERSIRAQLALRDLCARLGRKNIPVFIAHGNHDPLSSRLTTVDWPDNTVIFGAEPEAVPVKSRGDVIAMVHGISHATDREGRNLAQLFRRKPEFDGFQIGLLHCNVDGAVSEDRYAPCSLADLLDSGLDAWALGHAHRRNILSERPFIAYAGNMQGLTPNERGKKGCFLVTATWNKDGWICESEFIELGPVRWQETEIELGETNTLDALAESLRACAEEAGSERDTILTINLTGRTDLDADLRKPDAASDLMRELAEYGERRPCVWIRKINIRTAQKRSETEVLDRDDLLGETGRLASKLRADPELLQAMARTAFAPLYGSRRHGGLPGEPEDLENMLERALSLCQDALEQR